MQYKGADVFGRGVYSINQAAKLTGLKTRRARDWFRGLDTPSKSFRPVFNSDYPILHDDYSISFLDLIELKIGGTLREMGVSLHYLRQAYTNLKTVYGDHPFCTREVYCGGRRIFTREVGETVSRYLYEAITNQAYIDTVILPFLERVEYDPLTNKAIRWRIADGVVIDPAFRFGAPIVEETGITTSTLKKSFYANGESAEVVADWYGVEPEHVMAAVDFENGLAA